jgi:hypothetical protein
MIESGTGFRAVITNDRRQTQQNVQAGIKTRIHDLYLDPLRNIYGSGTLMH